MFKPIYIIASNRLQMTGWYIADERGAKIPNGRAYPSRSECCTAIAALAR